MRPTYQSDGLTRFPSCHKLPINLPGVAARAPILRVLLSGNPDHCPFLSDAFTVNLNINSPPSKAFCLRPFERSFSIFGGGRAIALHVRRSESSTGATANGFDLRALGESQNTNFRHHTVRYASIWYEILGRKTYLLDNNCCCAE